MVLMEHMADVNAQDDERRVPLHLAAQNGKTWKIQLKKKTYFDCKFNQV